MSRKPETTFIGSVHKRLPDELHREKMNNPYYSGTADVWYSGTKNDLWVEYKFIVIPARETTLIKPEFSALQIEWLDGRLKEGRNVAAIIGCKEGGVVVRGGAWGEPFTLAQFKLKLQHRDDIAAWITSQTVL